MKKITLYFGLFAMLVVAAHTLSCKKDPEPEVLAGFSYQVDANDFHKVIFANASENYTSLSWDFGDGSATSSDENPVHVYTSVGTYKVKLTATGKNGQTNTQSQDIAISDPNAELFKLVGDVSKTWKLLRVAAPGRWPLEVGPITKDQVWWAQGRDNDEIALRPCIMNDEYTFGRDGSYKYNSNGDFWAEGGVFEPANLCQTTSPDNLKGPGGVDLSAFGDGVHAFTLTTGTKPTVTLNGLGAFIGLPKIATDYEVNIPQQSVTLDIIKLTDGAVDTLILESDWKFQNNTSGLDDAYWKITLVHYDDPNAEPAIPDPKPVVAFSGAADGLTVT
ncbi:MAG TPA: PKD domain-containing protein, partial [Saprospiraceae bacterium]|nr:PKD domain-containing protein [Saprospiraceae bacterium]